MQGVPKTYEEAMTDRNAEDWKKAMDSEYNSLMENETWKLTNLPVGKKAIKNKWVFVTKKDNDGNIIRYKARLVAKGYSQIEGIDYRETFAPVVRYTSIRFLLSMAARLDLKISQMDAVTAFLNGELEEEVYMEQPKGYEDKSQKCCKLIKSIYGLKQSSRVWNKTLNRVLIEFNLEQSKNDQCIYYLKNDTKDILIVCIYVDDILIFSNNEEKENQLKDLLNKNFKMKDMGVATSILGIRITRNFEQKTISIDQKSYIEDILKRFKMLDCNPVTTPLDVNQKISSEMSPKSCSEKEDMKLIPYREAIGSLLFAGLITRPDISFAVNFLSRYCNNPGKAHWGAVKRIMRYLKGTLDFCLTYKQLPVNTGLTGFSDADWASDLDARKSTTGYMFVVNDGAVSWNSKKQATVALSSTEAEYMAIVTTIQEGIWIRGIMKELFGENPVIKVFGDNKGALQVITNNSYSPRTKHIDIKAKFIQDKIEKGEITVQYLPTNEMPADILTKAVSRSKFMDLTPLFGLNHGILNNE